jgi:hypothetical protein
VWTGAAVTAILFTVGKFLIGLYLGKSSVASSFGIFGSLALLMVWVYYSAQIFLFGAEFTWVYANRHGSLRERLQEKPKLAQASLPGTAEVHLHVALANTAAANTSWEDVPARHIKLRKHLPEFAVSAAFLVGALLGTTVQKRFHFFGPR